MSNWHGNGERPKLGSKIEYAVSKNKVETAVYGAMIAFYPLWDYDSKEYYGLSDKTPWKHVLMWKYVDENYNYGKGVEG